MPLRPLMLTKRLMFVPLKRLSDLKMVYGIDAYRKLGRNQFRIALFHNILHEDLVKLTELLSLAIESRALILFVLSEKFFFKLEEAIR